jgi:nucleoside-diphosphate-sugar epimerase
VKNVLICGASGFMGRNIADRFLQTKGYRVYGASRSRVPENSGSYEDFYVADLTTSAGIEEVFGNGAVYDVVVQAAANTSGSKDIIHKPYLHVTDNAVMNSLILRACYDYAAGHFMFLSCGVMYDPRKSPVVEDDFAAGDEIPSAYFGVGWTKVYVEKMCEFYASLGRTKHTAIRHSNTYGPHDKYDLEKSHMFGATIAKVMNAVDNSEIVVWGDGKTERDLVYVDDVVDFIVDVVNKQTASFELVNVGYGTSFSVIDIVKKVIKESGKNLTIVHDLTKPSINTRLSLSCDKAKERFGWQPKTSLGIGIKKTIDWYNSNIKSD